MTNNRDRGRRLSWGHTVDQLFIQVVVYIRPYSCYYYKDPSISHNWNNFFCFTNSSLLNKLQRWLKCTVATLYIFSFVAYPVLVLFCSSNIIKTQYIPVFYENLTNVKLKSQEICEDYWESNLQFCWLWGKERELPGPACPYRQPTSLHRAQHFGGPKLRRVILNFGILKRTKKHFITSAW